MNGMGGILAAAVVIVLIFACAAAFAAGLALVVP